MRKLLLATLLVASYACAALSAENSDDKQLWMDMKVSFKTEKKYSFTLFTQQRIDIDELTPKLYVFDPKVGYKINDYVSLAYTNRLMHSGASKIIVAPMFDVAFSAPKFSGVALGFRTRLEFDTDESGDNFKSRNLFSAAYKIAAGDFTLTPYLYDELFFTDLAGDAGFTRNRFYVGIKLGHDAIPTLAPYFMVQHSKSSPEADAYKRLKVAGFAISFGI